MKQLKDKTIILNFCGSPGCGKSTMMARVFAGLKINGIECELAPEYVKGKIFEESFKTLQNQIYVFGKQHHILNRLKDKVDVIVTDSPIFLSVIYDNQKDEVFKNFVIHEFKKQDNINYYLERRHEYNPAGRMQNEEESEEIAKDILSVLNKNSIDYEIIHSSEEWAEKIIKKIVEIVNNKNF